MYQTPYCHASPCTYIKSPSNTRSNHQKFPISLFDITIFHEINKTSYHGRRYKLHIQGPVSISDKTSYCKISRSLEAVRFVRELSDRSEIWQAPRQHCCRCACQISKWCDHLNYQCRGFETSRDLTVRRLVRYWNGAMAALCHIWWLGSPAKNGDVDKNNHTVV